MARRYEMLVLLDVGIPEEKLNQLIQKLEEMITTSESGEVIKLDRWGKKRLAYEIKKKQFGYYVLIDFEAMATLPKELDRFCRLEVGIIRHMILHIEERVLKLQDKESKIKLAMEERRREAANKSNDDVVEDMLPEKPVVVKEEPKDAPAEDKTEAADKKVAEEVVEAKAEEVKTDEKDGDK